MSDVAAAAPLCITRFDDLCDRARALAGAGDRGLLGITGPPAAGKTTLARALASELGELAACVGMDGFHLSQELLASLGRTERKGAIDTFDAEGFVTLGRRLRTPTPHTVYAPEFRRELDQAIAGAVPIEPAVRLVVVEGNYLLAADEPWTELRSLLDEVWYCEPDDESRVANLIARHRAFGKSEREARQWALGPDQRNAALIVATRSRADVVVNLEDDLAPRELPAIAR